MRTGDEHYPSDMVGAARQLAGAGILAWLTGDQLHPPMLADEEMWADGSAWADGARRYVLDMANAVDLAPGERVLDVGCGVCGPARLLVDSFDVKVTAITNSNAHAQTSFQLNQINPTHAQRIDVQAVQDRESWPAGPYDVAWCLNILYQVPDHQEIYGHVADLLVPGGRFVLDDWMATDQITEADLRLFAHHFQYRNFIRISRVEAELSAVGFRPAIRMLDRGEAGRGAMHRHFERVMHEHFLPMLAHQWPDGPEAGISGRQMALDFIEAVNHTIKLYKEGKLTYRTLVATKVS